MPRAAPRMHDDEVDVDEQLVRRLLAQLPEFAHLPLAIVEPWGTDNAIWRLGGDFVVRFPRIDWAQRQVGLEAVWLPKLAPRLPIEVPEPVAVGEPAHGYPFQWAVHRWIEGRGAAPGFLGDPLQFAADLAGTVDSLRRCPVEDAPPARGRARPIGEYDAATRAAIASAGDLIDVDAATEIWQAAMDADRHVGDPVWVHGDLEGNCLVRDDRLIGLVDWGSACVGDPAVDVQVVWSDLFTERSRNDFIERLCVDGATLARSRGAAINQACAALPYYLDTYPLIVERSWHKLEALGVETRRRRPP